MSNMSLQFFTTLFVQFTLYIPVTFFIVTLNQLTYSQTLTVRSSFATSVFRESCRYLLQSTMLYMLLPSILQLQASVKSRNSRQIIIIRLHFYWIKLQLFKPTILVILSKLLKAIAASSILRFRVSSSSTRNPTKWCSDS